MEIALELKELKNSLMRNKVWVIMRSKHELWNINIKQNGEVRKKGENVGERGRKN
jgi:hypothetical protein